MRYLSAEEILVIHDETIEKEDGILGIRDVGLLYSLTERPKMAMMGQEFYPDIFSKAAVILEGLATYHVFTDGNKRTAFIACMVFLGLNGYDVTAPLDSTHRFILAVAQKKMDMPKIVAWLKKNSRNIAKEKSHL
ncbi:type II toxin-antitoxin system death-on-curing family toxin [Candidatus Uhrbacteria bacterium]|nr:type II toxin-antitoxin system death-on-curing family toxin [Candidatus Uhrbacteria bacterium]